MKDQPLNRCSCCDVTDEDNPQAGIIVVGPDNLCRPCYSSIQTNLEDLSIHDTIEFNHETFDIPEAIVQDDHWVEAPVPEVPEQ